MVYIYQLPPIAIDKYYLPQKNPTKKNSLVIKIGVMRVILSRLHHTPPQHTPKHNNNNKITQKKHILKSLECGVHPIKSGEGVVDVAGCLCAQTNKLHTAHYIPNTSFKHLNC